MMSVGVIICIFFLFASELLQKGLTEMVLTQEEPVMAAVGGEAHLSCQLRETKDVLQVTWQKILPNEDKNMATFSHFVGQTVNPNFTDKVEFKDLGLNKTSVVIRNITEEDECCYRCMFNAYPDGSLTAATCIQLYELHEPVLHVRESNSSAESVVSCSATGRPAPTVTLTVTQQHLNFSHHNTVSVNNTNGTVTITATAILSGFHGNGAQVGCAARVLSTPQMEVFVMIPELKEKFGDGSIWTILVVCVVVACCVAAIIAVQLRQKHKNGDPGRIQTPQKTTQDSQQNKTPLITKENEVIRQRTPIEKSPENNRPKPSPSVAKKLKGPKS